MPSTIAPLSGLEVALVQWPPDEGIGSQPAKLHATLCRTLGRFLMAQGALHVPASIQCAPPSHPWVGGATGSGQAIGCPQCPTLGRLGHDRSRHMWPQQRPGSPSLVRGLVHLPLVIHHSLSTLYFATLLPAMTVGRRPRGSDPTQSSAWVRRRISHGAAAGDPLSG